MPCHRVSAAAAALAACFVLLFSCLISAEHIEFDVWHRLGSDANSQWKPAGMLSGEVDTGALVDAAAAALRGGGGRISPPPKAASPVLTLFRDEKNGAIAVEEAKRAAERGQGYSIKLKRKLDRSATKKKTKTKNAALFTSAPPHCAAAALSGALPLKLDGTLPRSTPRGSGGGGIRVTGVSFDFYGGPCKGGGGGGPAGTKAQAQQRVPLWLPAAAPPLLPPPPPPAAAKKAAATAALAQAQAEAARRRAAGDGEGGGGGVAFDVSGVDLERGEDDSLVLACGGGSRRRCGLGGEGGREGRENEGETEKRSAIEMGRRSHGESRVVARGDGRTDVQ